MRAAPALSLIHIFVRDDVAHVHEVRALAAGPGLVVPGRGGLAHRRHHREGVLALLAGVDVYKRQMLTHRDVQKIVQNYVENRRELRYNPHYIRPPDT